MSYTLINSSDLYHSDSSFQFEGYLHGATHISFFVVDAPVGSGPSLHTHPYEEIFIVQEGQATYTIDSTILEVKAGQIVIVPAGVPHKFVNSGEGHLRQVNIHASPQMITDWLED